MVHGPRSTRPELFLRSRVTAPCKLVTSGRYEPTHLAHCDHVSRTSRPLVIQLYKVITGTYLFRNSAIPRWRITYPPSILDRTCPDQTSPVCAVASSLLENYGLAVYSASIYFFRISLSIAEKIKHGLSEDVLMNGLLAYNDLVMVR